MSFDEPWRLAILLAPLALLAAYVVAQRSRRKYALRFTSVDLLASVAPRRPGWQRHVSAVLMLGALSALVLGFAKPAGTKKVARQRGTVMLAIDTSGSMAATDVAPRRLVAAQDAARRFIAGLPAGLKIGLLSFDSTARVLVAPTSDHVPVLAAVNALTIGGGTATGAAIESALASVAALPPGANGQKAPAAIVLMSDGSPTIGKDGQSPGQTVADAAAQAKAAQVPIDTIAFGTTSGTVTVQGENVPVPADPQAMAAIASASGGKSFTAKNGSELNSVYDQIRKVVGFDSVPTDLTEWFVGLSLVLAVLTAAAALVWMQRIP
ncbi:MAG TPA: VWA domain-containing protein [Acidimicrobiia bacterium]|nr:VWA domain-containing protein [Acidimicrobiia bacterium]